LLQLLCSSSIFKAACRFVCWPMLEHGFTAYKAPRMHMTWGADVLEWWYGKGSSSRSFRVLGLPIHVRVEQLGSIGCMLKGRVASASMFSVDSTYCCSCLYPEADCKHAVCCDALLYFEVGFVSESTKHTQHQICLTCVGTRWRHEIRSRTGHAHAIRYVSPTCSCICEHSMTSQIALQIWAMPCRVLFVHSFTRARCCQCCQLNTGL
jgi:hypothetical protein